MAEKEIIPADQILPHKLHIIPMKGNPIFPGIFTPLMITSEEDIEGTCAHLAKRFVDLALINLGLDAVLKAVRELRYQLRFYPEKLLPRSDEVYVPCANSNYIKHQLGSPLYNEMLSSPELQQYN